MLSKLQEWVVQRFLRIYFPLIIRKALLMVSTYLGSKGLVEASNAVDGIGPEVIAEIAAAIISGVTSLSWSVADKFGKEQVPLPPKVIKK